MGRYKGRVRLRRVATFIRIAVCAAIAATLSACGSSTSPIGPTSPLPCITATITIGRSSNGAPASPGQGMLWGSYFQTTVLAARSAVYIVDITPAPAGCVATPWTAVSADGAAVQLSPARGTGLGKVELFIVPNTGAQRSTLVTIAEQSVLITQAGG